ncbi:hypothetical protein FJ959_22420 [Mesorhizobium sp. B2-2-4]|uniref:hypothetical protein n=1 Tax=unclassified Mesorhizobium TaxID=325217 RepID=UPI001129C9A0|nr:MULTISPECIES: hypothetical protein [unclassified Mesorhizobium]TPM53285.1 hypothetical protein FJ959_22420 [Mesorhizobium sp. B2-2-4]TPM62071.1 hypothetical protein FJ965_20945 [Mesorhizobium sp. B2-2-1]TPN68442.1 hypothetical protein FJ984_11425 [Mesorhizobium sp. B1-1-3]
MADDWMHPRTSFSYTTPPPKNGTYFQIQRKRATPVSGNVSYIHSWDVWEEFATKEERDAKLAKLREQESEWHLRGRTLHYSNGQLISGGDPFEYRDD